MLRHGTILMILVALVYTGCASQQDPARFVGHYVELLRSRDVEGLLALHTADAEFLIPGQEPIRGTSALRDLYEWDAVLRSELLMAGIRAERDTIVIDVLVERNRWFTALGLDEVRYKSGTRFVLDEGRIDGIYPAAFADETQQRLMERFQPLMDWLGEHRQDVLPQLLPGGRFRYDASTAKLWLEVLADWNTYQQRSER